MATADLSIHIADVAGLLSLAIGLYPLRTKPQYDFAVMNELDYDIVNDWLTIDVDSEERGRAYRIEWRATDEAMAVVAHWTGFGEDGEPDGCVPSKDECPVNDAQDLLTWLRLSLRNDEHPVAVARNRAIDREAAIADVGE